MMNKQWTQMQESNGKYDWNKRLKAMIEIVWKQWLNDSSFELNERKKCLKCSPSATPNNDGLNV